MDPDDRAYVVGLAEEVFGAGVPGHRWPFLVDEEGGPLEVDAFWPDHGVAVAIVGDDAARWHFAPFALNLRDVRLLLVHVGGLPTDDGGRLVRDPARVRSALITFGFPGSRRDFEDLVGETDGAAAAGPVGGPAPSWSVGPVGGGTGWETFVVSGDDGIMEGPEAFEGWNPGADEDEEPWLPDWRYEDHDGDPWDDDEDVVLPEQDAVLELGWRSRPIALAALGAVVLARRVLDPGALGETEPTALQVLAALGVPDEEDAAADRASPRGLAARLALSERVVRSVLDELVEGDLARRTDDPEAAGFELTPAGRDAVRAWLERIAPAFAGWPPSGPDVDDAA